MPHADGSAVRVAALAEYHLIDSLPETALDGVARLAAIVCNTPMAQVNVVDDAWQYTRGSFGAPPSAVTLQDSFCSHVVESGAPVVVADSMRDVRFATNPFVAGEPRIRAYAGFPVAVPGGVVVGTVCVADLEPRLFTDTQLEGLRELAAQAAAVFELHGDQIRNAERFAALIRYSSDVIALVDGEGIVRYTSPAVEGLLGVGADDLVGTNVFDVVGEADVSLAVASFAGTVAADGQAEPLQLHLRHADGSLREVEVIANNLLRNPSVGGVVMNVRDLGDRHRSETALLHQATHDQLTGLPNRILLREYLEGTLATTSDLVAVLFLDLDRFKVVNDSLGHQTGDRLLMAMATRIRSALRPDDLVARLGGDEFVVVCSRVGGRREAIAVANRVADAVDAPLWLDGREVVTTASIGIVVAGPRYGGADEVLRQADAAMYAAKERGRACAVVFDDKLADQVSARLEEEQDLRRALDRGELELWFQPIVALDAPAEVHPVVGAEALMRWHHPTRGLVGPADFIPLAEDLGVINQIGGWALGEACSLGARWSRTVGRQFGVSVNLSAIQLADPGFTVAVAQALVDTGLDPAQLALELTESTLAAEGHDTVDTLTRLSELGARLSIDDFGTGYSSLSYLKRFPVSVLKIDRSFVGGLGQNLEDEAIVRSLIGLAHTLGLGVVAEGVETEQQLEMLRRFDCDLAQGFHLGHPVPAGEFLELADRIGTQVQMARSRPSQ